jgi:DNA mismatch repair ATPase MutS
MWNSFSRSILQVLISFAPKLHSLNFEKLYFSAASLTFVVKSPLGTIHMDSNTIRNLELVRNIRSGDWKHSLMGYMNHCKTAMGSRLLRASILQPMQSGSNSEKLNARLDVSSIKILSIDC